MRSVWALMVLLLQVFQGVEGHCDARQNNTICYGALGGTIEVQLMDKDLEINRCSWYKKSQKIFDWRNNVIVLNKLENRSVFIPQIGTYRISDLTRNDSDTYHLEISYSNGTFIKKLTQQLIIEATNHWPVIVGVVTVLIVGVTLGCVLKKKCKKNSKEEEHEQELTYADVRILQQPERQPQQTTEIEVEYGQVKFSEPRQNNYKVAENN